VHYLLVKCSQDSWTANYLAPRLQNLLSTIPCSNSNLIWRFVNKTLSWACNSTRSFVTSESEDISLLLTPWLPVRYARDTYGRVSTLNVVDVPQLQWFTYCSSESYRTGCGGRRGQSMVCVMAWMETGTMASIGEVNNPYIIIPILLSNMLRNVLYVFSVI
jgi:hypothetical protein